MESARQLGISELGIDRFKQSVYWGAWPCEFVHPPNRTGVGLAGEWEEECYWLDIGTDGTCRIILELPVGEFIYKFIDGDEKVINEGVVQVSELGMSVNQFSKNIFGGAVVSDSAVFPAATSGARQLKDQNSKGYFKVDFVYRDVQFAKQVRVAGPLFVDDLPLTKNENGEYVASSFIPPGVYDFYFKVGLGESLTAQAGPQSRLGWNAILSSSKCLATNLQRIVIESDPRIVEEKEIISQPRLYHEAVKMTDPMPAGMQEAIAKVDPANRIVRNDLEQSLTALCPKVRLVGSGSGEKGGGGGGRFWRTAFKVAATAATATAAGLVAMAVLKGMDGVDEGVMDGEEEEETEEAEATKKTDRNFLLQGLFPFGGSTEAPSSSGEGAEEETKASPHYEGHSRGGFPIPLPFLKEPESGATPDTTSVQPESTSQPSPDSPTASSSAPQGAEAPTPAPEQEHAPAPQGENLQVQQTESSHEAPPTDDTTQTGENPTPEGEANVDLSSSPARDSQPVSSDQHGDMAPTESETDDSKQQIPEILLDKASHEIIEPDVTSSKVEVQPTQNFSFDDGGRVETFAALGAGQEQEAGSNELERDDETLSNSGVNFASSTEGEGTGDAGAFETQLEETCLNRNEEITGEYSASIREETVESNFVSGSDYAHESEGFQTTVDASNTGEIDIGSNQQEYTSEAKAYVAEAHLEGEGDEFIDESNLMDVANGSGSVAVECRQSTGFYRDGDFGFFLSSKGG